MRLPKEASVYGAPAALGTRGAWHPLAWHPLAENDAVEYIFELS